MRDRVDHKALAHSCNELTAQLGLLAVRMSPVAAAGHTLVACFGWLTTMEC